MRVHTRPWITALVSTFVGLAGCGDCDGGSDPSPAEPNPTERSSEVDEGPQGGPCDVPEGAELAHAAVPEGLCAWVWAEGIDDVRGLISVEGGDVLAVERARDRVVALRDDDGDRVVSPDERTVLAEAPGLNHGLAVHDGHLYASSATTVYRWRYEPGVRSELGEPEVIIRGIPDGGHTTRTLLFDAEGHLYVSVGSEGNVDDDASRSRVMRYDPTLLEGAPVEWRRGTVWGDGLRNEVGLAFDAEGRLWGVQNGLDQLRRDDLGGDIHADNPAEEINLLTEPGRFHGYPYCWTEYLLPDGVGRGRGSQWAHPKFLDDGVHDDAWCRDRANVKPPEFSLQAHTAPLDLMFWAGGALPDEWRGDLLVSRHGSWNRPVPVGYDVVRIRFEEGEPVAVESVLAHAGEGAKGPGWPHRPVAMAVGPQGALLVTSDATDTILAVAAD